MNNLKKIVLLLLISTASISAQDKWRTLTLQTTNGVSTNGEFITTSSVSISYELKNKFSIENWNGINFTSSDKSLWISSQTTLNKSFKKLTVGVGVLYMQSRDLNLPKINNISANTFGVITISKRFKL